MPKLLDSREPHARPRVRRFLGFARKRSRPIEQVQVHQITGTGRIDWHSPQGPVPKDVARFEEFQLALGNPDLAEKVTDEDLVGYQRTGWNVRGYSPAEYAKSGKGVEHEKAFSLEDKEELISYYKRHEEGRFHSSAESSGQDRGYLQEVWKHPETGDVKRRQVPWETLLRYA